MRSVTLVICSGVTAFSTRPPLRSGRVLNHEASVLIADVGRHFFDVDFVKKYIFSTRSWDGFVKRLETVLPHLEVMNVRYRFPAEVLSGGSLHGPR